LRRNSRLFAVSAPPAPAPVPPERAPAPPEPPRFWPACAAASNRFIGSSPPEPPDGAAVAPVFPVAAGWGEVGAFAFACAACACS
jgi:hypothetical protein